MEEGKAQSGWGGARPPRRYRAVVSAELYEEMGAGVLLVVGGEGPEVLKGPRELRGVMWLVCVCGLEEADVGESAGQRRETGLCWAR